MTTQHTPGPWRIGDAGATIFGPPTGNPSPETIATITHRVRLSAKQEANAKLIAAAPELLEVLRLFIDAQDRDNRDPLRYEKAANVIAKATK